MMNGKDKGNSAFSIHNSELIVPEIRFKGFSEVWEEYPLSTFIGSLDAGVSVNSGDRPASEGEFGILKTSCVTNGFFDPNENKIVFKAKEINRLKEPVLENTIIISRMNTPVLVGANAYVSKGFPNYFLPDRLWAAKPTSIGDLKFIAYILGSGKGRLALSDLATGTSGSMKNISKPSVLGLKFHTPQDKEQTQIGNYFQKLDSLINQHQQKHDKLSNIKKAMLELMFPKQGENIPEIRFKGFSGEWVNKSLADAAPLRGGFAFQSFQFCEAGVPIVKISNILSTGEVGGEFNYFKETSNDENYLLPNGSALLAMSGATTGKISILRSINNTKFYQNQRVGYFKRNSDLDYLFISTLVRSHLFSDKLNAVLVAGAQPNVSSKEIDFFEFRMPMDIEEQTKIGNYFQKLDTLINQHQQQITKLNNIKQACLSKMFAG
ncbi:MAG: restriction endonuclease subunit S [Methylobacter sp.]|nr:restriction endonuclease subunit S [Methylobacter sp.]